MLKDPSGTGGHCGRNSMLEIASDLGWLALQGLMAFLD